MIAAITNSGFRRQDIIQDAICSPVAHRFAQDIEDLTNTHFDLVFILYKQHILHAAPLYLSLFLSLTRSCAQMSAFAFLNKEITFFIETSSVA